MAPCWSCDQPKFQQWGKINKQDRSNHWVSNRTPVGTSASPVPRVMNVNRGTSVSSTCSQSTGGTLHSVDPCSTNLAGPLEHSLELSSHICLLEKLPLFPVPSGVGAPFYPRCCFWAGESLGIVSLAPDKSLRFWLKTWDRRWEEKAVLWLSEQKKVQEGKKILKQPYASMVTPGKRLASAF